ncbi:MAG: ATP-binding domain-containing protein, partial [Candidatus Omnitrophica bacterium]|nr:ATP-binding domain-containing protein [Candidatus Omnitrophota bacterium]
LPEQIKTIVNSFYKEYLVSHYLDYEQRLADIQSLLEISGSWNNVEEFISQTSLQEHFRGEIKNTGEALVLSTIHQAKGLEWKIVFIIGVSAFHFPHSLSSNDFAGIEEERRVFYVGITRAKEDLYITYHMSDPRNFSFRRSIFIQEIPDHLIEQWKFD